LPRRVIPARDAIFEKANHFRERHSGDRASGKAIFYASTAVN
jgi:hypothetical protein